MTPSNRAPQPTRRAFLRAAGTLLALPYLESLLPKEARAATSTTFPQRLITFYVPCGMVMESLTPQQSGANFDITPTLQPLASLQSYLTVVSGLVNHSAQVQVAGQGGDHGRGTGSFGTGNPVAANGSYNGGGTSYDQMVANKIGSQTRFPSLQLAVEGGGVGGNCDSGFNCAYMNTLSWADPYTPLMPSTQPSKIFTQLFGSSNSQETAQQAAVRLATRKSILDGVLDRINAVNKRLGVQDQQKLGQYLNSVREVEREVTMPTPAACGSSSITSNGTDFPSTTQQQVNLMKLAVQCDATRVISMMIGTSGSNHNCAFLQYNNAPIDYAFHEMTHLISYNGDANACHGALTVVNTWSVSMVADFAKALHDTAEGPGNMLDNTLIYLGSEMSNGSIHNHDDMPVVLVGKGGGAYTGNQHISYTNGETLADMYMYMMRQFGVQMSAFGADGKAALTGLG